MKRKRGKDGGGKEGKREKGPDNGEFEGLGGVFAGTNAGENGRIWDLIR